MDKQDGTIEATLLNKEIELLYNWHGENLLKLGVTQTELLKKIMNGDYKIERGPKLNTFIIRGIRYGVMQVTKEDFARKGVRDLVRNIANMNA